MKTYGANEDLDIEFSIDKPNLRFGVQSGTDVRFDFVVKMGIKKYGSMNYLVYDEFNIRTDFNIEINSEVLFANFASLEVTPNDPNRRVPIFTTLDINEDDYSDFWS